MTLKGLNLEFRDIHALLAAKEAAAQPQLVFRECRSGERHGEPQGHLGLATEARRRRRQPSVPSPPDALLALSTIGALAELLEFYAQQNGLPHWFILYGTWKFLTLEEAFELTGILIRSSAYLGMACS